MVANARGIRLAMASLASMLAVRCSTRYPLSPFCMPPTRRDAPYHTSATDPSGVISQRASGTIYASRASQNLSCSPGNGKRVECPGCTCHLPHAVHTAPQQPCTSRNTRVTRKAWDRSYCRHRRARVYPASCCDAGRHRKLSLSRQWKAGGTSLEPRTQDGTIYFLSHTSTL